MLAEVQLRPADFIAPIFVSERISEKKAIEAMPGVFQHSLSSLHAEIEKVASAGIPAVMLFGIPVKKNGEGTESCSSDGIVQKAISLIKHSYPQLIVSADCCLCEYTDHGHCGIMGSKGLDNARTLPILGEIALSYAENGADIIVPSGMMDGAVHAIRSALDRHGHDMTSIMAHTIKYASHFYGPFREAAGAGEVFKGDRKHHQAAPTQKREALREADLDVKEGADFLLVKPGLPYLDIVSLLHERFPLPIAAYQVSGEYAMLKAGAKAGAFDEREAFYETCLGMKRAGAQMIVSYYAVELAKILKGKDGTV
jgi:porphobilinogen synthase